MKPSISPEKAPLALSHYPEQFFAVWMRVEAQIARLTGDLGAEDVRGLPGQEDDAMDDQQQLQLRRELVEAMLREAGDNKGGLEALSAASALDELLSLFGARVACVVERSEFLRDGAALVPGQVALEQLMGEAEFLRLAHLYSTAFARWMVAQVARAAPKESNNGQTLARTTRDLPVTMRFYNDAVQGVAVRALSQGYIWKPEEGFAYAYSQRYDQAQVTIGLPAGEGAHDLWTYLRDGGPRMVKAHYALWGRYYDDFQEGSRYIVISIPQFCADLGYTRHHKGGFRLEHKQEAMQILFALTSIVMTAAKQLPNGKNRRLRGPLWARGLDAEENDQYSDLFGQMRTGDARTWEPVAFSYAPGPWFDDPEWRRYHKYMGKIGNGLMRLSVKSDQWAILIGGYLGTVLRSNGYRTRVLHVGTILHNSGLAQSEDARTRAKVWQEKLWKALDRLASEEIGVIKSWRLLGVDTAEPDMDDPNELALYGERPEYPPGDWRNWKIEIETLFEEDAQRLADGVRGAINRAKARSRARKKAQDKSKNPTKT